MKLIYPLFITFLTLLNPSMAFSSETITVYKSATCGCCKDWIKHLEQNGFSVNTYNTDNMNAVKSTLGITPNLASCHTAEVGGYVIEGHVPAKEIQRLLKEKPKAAGLSVPGMPMGSPGMEGPRKDPYQVLIFDNSGEMNTYATY